MDHLTDDTSETSSDADRLEKLARFQAHILTHALSFPRAQHVLYSTCSVHVQENEQVVENVHERVKDT